MAIGFCTSGSEAASETLKPGGALILASEPDGLGRMWLGSSVLKGVGKVDVLPAAKAAVRQKPNAGISKAHLAASRTAAVLTDAPDVSDFHPEGVARK